MNFDCLWGGCMRNRYWFSHSINFIILKSIQSFALHFLASTFFYAGAICTYDICFAMQKIQICVRCCWWHWTSIFFYIQFFFVNCTYVYKVKAYVQEQLEMATTKMYGSISTTYKFPFDVNRMNEDGICTHLIKQGKWNSYDTSHIDTNLPFSLRWWR